MSKNMVGIYAGLLTHNQLIMKSHQNVYTGSQLAFLVGLRLLIGWHFLYEGLVKLWNPNWSAAGYLMDSKGPWEEYFYKLAGNPEMLKIADFLNVWGLILVGAGLIAGLMTRWAAVGGMLLLAMYYASHPPFIGLTYALPSEGSYLWVNKNLIELVALGVVMVFPTGNILGLDRFFRRKEATQSTVNNASGTTASQKETMSA